MAKSVLVKGVWSPATRDKLPPENQYLGGSAIQDGWRALERISRNVLRDDARAYREICPGGDQ
eukprot:2784844-Lingulodinium_polyedra.AAC.1